MDGTTAFKKRHVRNRSFALAPDANPANKQSLSRLQKFVRVCQYGVIGSLERFFSWYGELVATHPRKAILVCISLTLLGGLGLIRFYEEGDAASLVIPRNSKFRNDIDLLDNNFPREIRVHSIVYQAENVLTPRVLQAIYKQRRALQQVSLRGKYFKDMCIKVPILKIPDRSRNPQSFQSTTPKPAEIDDFNDAFFDDFDAAEESIDDQDSSGLPPLLSLLIPEINSTTLDIDTLQRLSDQYYPYPYCFAAQFTEMACLENNIVELWANNGVYDQESDMSIQSLSQAEILDKINNNNVSQIFLKEKNFTELLGDIQYNAKGEIVGARAVEIKFFTSVNVTAFQLYGTASRGEKIDYESYEYEGELIKAMMQKDDFPPELVSYVNIQRQFFESFVGQTFKDADKLAVGYVIVFVFVNIMLSKLNFVEQRVWLSVVGIVSVAMGMVLGYGFCSGLGLFYSAAHTVIPFLLLGIGIDNIFVITQAYDTVDTSSSMSLPKRFGQTMQHAGVAVSVTTFTDVFAFLVGSNTVLPGLESFCIYAAVSIFCIYVMQITHFVAWMSLDEQRMRESRDGCCFCCLTHTHFKPANSQKEPMLNRVFLAIGKQLNKIHAKIIVLSLTILFIVGGVWGTLSLTQEYLPEWLLPPEAEVAKWFESKREFFPKAGEPGFIMIQQIDIPQEFGKIDELVTKISNLTGNIDTIIPWHTEFRKYVETYNTENKTFQDLMKEEGFFKNKLTQFLFSPKGANFQANFWFGGKLECGSPAPDILLQAIPYYHLRFERSREWIPAMEAVETIVDSVQFSNYSFPIALTYINWKADSIVGTELLRNVGIALVCIFVTTLATLGSWRGSLLVMMCVFFTCIDVTGFMHWWGLTIDITSMNVIIISVGLCVDFCAHIVHGFITGSGNRSSRVLYVMENIAPAVMNGGFSTILALALLVTSRSHIFISFFKIFLMICLFGLFHGLITLPVVLMLFGPIDSETKSNKPTDSRRKASLGFEAASAIRKNGQPQAGISDERRFNNRGDGDHELVPLNAGGEEVDGEKDNASKNGAQIVPSGGTSENGGKTDISAVHVPDAASSATFINRPATVLTNDTLKGSTGETPRDTDDTPKSDSETPSAVGNRRKSSVPPLVNESTHPLNNGSQLADLPTDQQFTVGSLKTDPSNIAAANAPANGNQKGVKKAGHKRGKSGVFVVPLPPVDTAANDDDISVVTTNDDDSANADNSVKA